MSAAARVAAWCAAVTLLLAGAGPAGAQSLLPVSGLQFGTLQPGISASVSPDDPGRAVVDVIGSGRIALQLIVPTTMVSAQGAHMPFEVGNGAAVLRWRNGNAHALTPGAITRVNVPPGQAPAVVHIGGRVHPGPTQAPGQYSATIVLQVVGPGT